MHSLDNITPDVEIYSVDEAFLDIIHVQKLWGTPETIARKIKETVYQASHCLCSIGLSRDKVTAKLAAKQQKPNGFRVVPPWKVKEFPKID